MDADEELRREAQQARSRDAVPSGYTQVSTMALRFAGVPEEWTGDRGALALVVNQRLLQLVAQPGRDQAEQCVRELAELQAQHPEFCRRLRAYHRLDFAQGWLQRYLQAAGVGGA